MRTYYNATLELKEVPEEVYEMLVDFLEDKNIHWEETEFNEYTIDDRSDSEKYDDYLWTLGDLHNDEVKMGIE